MQRMSRGALPTPYVVELESPGDRRFAETIAAATPGLAVKAGQKMHPGSTVVQVSRTWEPLGACCTVCGVVIFKGDYHRLRRNAVVCFDCS